jgi:hypothetical protein
LILNNLILIRLVIFCWFCLWLLIYLVAVIFIIVTRTTAVVTSISSTMASALETSSRSTIASSTMSSLLIMATIFSVIYGVKIVVVLCTTFDHLIGFVLIFATRLIVFTVTTTPTMFPIVRTLLAASGCLFFSLILMLRVLRALSCT